jgi:hypothetical protein
VKISLKLFKSIFYYIFHKLLRWTPIVINITSPLYTHPNYISKKDLHFINSDIILVSRSFPRSLCLSVCICIVIEQLVLKSVEKEVEKNNRAEIRLAVVRKL